jgi:flotillin
MSEETHTERKNRLNKETDERRLISVGVRAAFGGAALLGFAYMANRYHVSSPYEYLIKTGLGIQDLRISKKALLWPFQRITRVDLRPVNYSFTLHNMSKEKIEFALPMNFTFGPANPLEDQEGFLRYARLMHDSSPDTLTKTILGVVEGETRGLTSTLTVEEMFNARDKFKTEVLDKIKLHLHSLGLNLYNANIRELSDLDHTNKYFAFRKQRAVETANYDSQVAVSEARKTGEIGMKERQRDTQTALATMTAETKLVENQCAEKILWSESQLAQQKAAAHQAAEMKRIQADLETRRYEQEQMTQLEVIRKERELQTLRASDLSKTIIQAEQKTRDAEANATVVKMMAEAEAHATLVRSQAILEQEKRKAEGVQINLEAQAAGLSQLNNFDPSLVKFYLGLQEKLFEKVAQSQADALRDMKPNFSVWTTGPHADQSDPSAVITRTLQNMAPLFSGLGQQSGIQIPFLKDLLFTNEKTTTNTVVGRQAVEKTVDISPKL